MKKRATTKKGEVRQSGALAPQESEDESQSEDDASQGEENERGQVLNKECSSKEDVSYPFYFQL